MRPDDTTVQRLRRVAEALGPLRDRVVLVGGAATAFMITDAAAPEPRPTDDIDFVIDAASKRAYYAVEKDLRKRGFANRREPGDPICRWVYSGIVVDVMTEDEAVLGFSNQWYAHAIEHAVALSLGEDLAIKVISAPSFLATKLVAFEDRGNEDFLYSADMQDMVSIIDGRVELIEEIEASEPDLKEFVGRSFRSYLERTEFLDSISGHLLPDAASQARAGLVVDRIKRIAGLAL